MNDIQESLLRDIIRDTEKVHDASLKGIVVGKHLIAVKSRYTGLCTNMTRQTQITGDRLISLYSESVRDLALRLTDPLPEFPGINSFAMAAVNSLLPVPKEVLSLKAQDLIIEYGKGRNAAIIGHFPFVDEVGQEFKNLWVLDNHPRPGDLPADAAGELLHRADVVALTATTLVNGTCADLLKFIRKDAFTIMLGPSTPFAPCLFKWGIDALAGSSVSNDYLVTSSIREGLPQRELEGVDPVIWINKKN